MASKSLHEERLAEALSAIAAPNRLRLLRILRLPHTSTEIRLNPDRDDDAWDADRAISRQAVENHLGKLEGAKLIRGRSSKRGGRAVTEYIVNQGALFVLTDELRRLVFLHPPSENVTLNTSEPSAATDGPVVTGSSLPDGPALVNLSGPREGRAHVLEGDGPWTIGRLQGADVALPHDPFVSADNARVRKEGDEYVLEGTPAARNGTAHNWKMIEPGEPRRLVPGDTIGVGRSLLVFRR